MACDIPILFCIFNRPEVTARTFAAIARQKPKTLLIAGDGPRHHHPADAELVSQTRRIIEQVDWDCNLQASFQKENIGCRTQMAQAIHWGFDNAERLIILEDDCLPHDSFFPYCETLLEKYAEHPQVMTIGGINHLPIPCSNDYRFSKYPLIWGWASWRRAWRHYDLNMAAWKDQEIQQRVLSRWTQSEAEHQYWKKIFDCQAAGSINTWDYSWTFASWRLGGLTAVPRVNLVSNIGFGSSATHTLDDQSKLSNAATAPLKMVKHPAELRQDQEWDRQAQQFYFPVHPNADEHPDLFDQNMKKKKWIERLYRRKFAKRAG
jgi:hypothetical protein